MENSHYIMLRSVSDTKMDLSYSYRNKRRYPLIKKQNDIIDDDIIVGGYFLFYRFLSTTSFLQ